jgi:hypothetical protein
MVFMHVPERHSPYVLQYHQEWQLANRIDMTRRTDSYAGIAFWGGIALGAAALVGVGLSAPLRPEALIALAAAVLIEVAGLVLSMANFFLHVSISLQALNVKRKFPHNPLPARYLHAEFIRWIKRVDLFLTIVATIVATLTTFGIAAGITVPSGLGLGFLGWLATEIWAFGANRLVYREVRRQKSQLTSNMRPLELVPKAHSGH